jgi:hypothetical protein
MSSLSGKPDPVVLRIAMADVGEAFSQGLRDFPALLLRDIALASIYVIGSLVIVLYSRLRNELFGVSAGSGFCTDRAPCGGLAFMS